MPRPPAETPDDPFEYRPSAPAAEPETERAPADPGGPVNALSGVPLDRSRVRRHASGANPKSVGTQMDRGFQEPLGTRLTRGLGWAMLVLAVLVGGCFLAWRSGFAAAEREAQERESRRAAAEAEARRRQPAKAPAELTAEAAAVIEDALRREAAGDLPGADAALAKAQELSPDTPGILLRRAKIAVRSGQFVEAENLLAEAVRRGDRVGESRNLRALLAANQGQPEMADAFFRQAVDADPFSGRTFYSWGETLRKRGQLALAVEKLEGSLRRDRDRFDEELFRLKLQLAQVELAPEGGPAREIVAGASKPDAAPPLLAAAAAARLLAGDVRGGAALLERARAAAPPWLWREVLADPLFARFRTDAAVSALLQPK